MTRRGWIVLGAVGLVALLIGAGVLHHVRLKRAVEQYRRELAAQGNKLTAQELAPRKDPEALEAGAEFLGAASRTPGIGTLSLGIMRLVAPGRAHVAWQQKDLVDEKGTNLWPILTTILAEQQPALAAVCDVIEQNKIQFPIDYSSGFKMRFPPLASLKNETLTLCAAAIFELHIGNSAQASEYIHAGVHLSHAYDVEPLMISHLVRMAMTALMWAATWESLEYSNWTDAQLAELQDVWAKIEFIERLDVVLGMERVFTDTAFDHLRRSQSAWIDEASGATGFDMTTMDEVLVEPRDTAKKLAHGYVGYWPWRWWDSYSEQLFCDQTWQEGIRAQQALAQNRSYDRVQPPLTNAIGILRKRHRIPNELSIFGTPDELMEDFLMRAVTAQIQREMIVAGIALHRYRLRHGTWPTNLVQLVPDFLVELPRDYMDGQPLRYRVLENSKFLLYSIGQDFEDNGGDPNFTGETRHIWAGRDWVWPEPASPEEISAYWQKRAKRR